MIRARKLKPKPKTKPKPKHKSGVDGAAEDNALSYKPGLKDLCVAVVVGAQGLDGAMRIRTFTNTPSAIGAINGLVNESGVPIGIHVVRLQKGIVVARIEGVSDRTQAEAWIGKRLYVARSTLPKLEHEEYYHTDLIGLRVESPKGTEVGRVVAVHDFGAGGIIDVENGEGKSIMLPFSAETVPLVDISNGRLVVAPEAFELDEAKL